LTRLQTQGHQKSHVKPEPAQLVAALVKASCIERARRNAATVAGLAAGQLAWKRERSEADRGSSLSARRSAHPETQSRRRVLGKLQRPLWGRYVDRIYKAVSNAPREVPWFWGLEFHEWQGSDGPQYGNVATLEAAKQAFRAAWDRRLKAHGRR